MAKKTPPMYSNPAITEAKFRATRKQEMRKIWLRWGPRNEALKQARRKVQEGYFKNGNPKFVFEHQCAICHDWFKQESGKPQVEVDHIHPVGGWSENIKEWGKDLGRMYQALLCSVDDLRVLCKSCHLEVTNKQQKQKRKTK